MDPQQLAAVELLEPFDPARHRAGVEVVQAAVGGKKQRVLSVGQFGRLLELHGEHNLVVDLKKEEYLFRGLDEIFPTAAVTEILREAALA